MSRISSLPQSSGIYLITCTVNGKIYIGSTKNLRTRWNKHQADLRANRHGNRHLQNSWNKYGEVAFTFEILELVMPWAIQDREQYWLDKLRPFDKKIGFNLSVKSNSGMGGRKHTPESRAKISAAHVGKPLSPEHRAKIGAAGMGRKNSPGFSAKLSARNMGNQYGLGRTFTHTPEARQKMSIAAKKRGLSDNAKAAALEANQRDYIVTSPEGIEIKVRGLTRFCREMGLDIRTMHHAVENKKTTQNGWKVRRT